MTTETAPYEPPVKAYEPSQLLQASQSITDALVVANNFELAEPVVRGLNQLLATMDAEPEESLLKSDYGYMVGVTDRLSDTIRANFHPTNAVLLGHVSKSREHLKRSYQSTL